MSDIEKSEEYTIEIKDFGVVVRYPIFNTFNILNYFPYSRISNLKLQQDTVDLENYYLVFHLNNGQYYQASLSKSVAIMYYNSLQEKIV